MHVLEGSVIYRWLNAKEESTRWGSRLFNLVLGKSNRLFLNASASLHPSIVMRFMHASVREFKTKPVYYSGFFVLMVLSSNLLASWLLRGGMVSWFGLKLAFMAAAAFGLTARTDYDTLKKNSVILKRWTTTGS